MLRRLSCFAVAISFLSIGADARRLAAEELRTWTDSSGKYKIEAEFVEILDGKVRLKGKDGKFAVLPLAKVSKEDRDYLRELLKKRKADEAAAASPAAPTRGSFGANAPSRWKIGDRVQYRKDFEAAPATIVAFDGSRTSIRFDGDAEGEVTSAVTDWLEPLSDSVAMAAKWVWSPPVMKPAVPADVASVKKTMALQAAATKVAPDPEPAPTTTLKPGAITLGAPFFRHERLLASKYAVLAQPIAVTAYQGGRGVRDENCRLEVVDLLTGKLRGNLSGPAKLKFFCLSPSGRRMVTISEQPDTKAPAFLDVWDVGPTSLTHVVTWQPHAAGGWFGKLPKAEWLDDQRILTSGEDKRIVVWQVDGAKALVEISDSAFALSPGKKQIAVGNNKSVDIFDVATGAHLARIPCADWPGSLAFSPSGRKLALSGPLGFQILDVTGETPASDLFYIPTANGLQWLDEDYLMSDRGAIIDSTKRAVVWRYAYSGEAPTREQGRFWYTAKPRTGDALTLANVVLPHAAVRQASAAIDAVSVFAVKPGMSVAIDVDLGDPAANDVAVKSLTGSAAAAGLTVAVEAPLKISVRTRSGESKEIKYHKFGSFTDDVTMNLPTRLYDLEFLAAGERVWSVTWRQDPPMSPTLKEGESIQAAVAREMAVTGSIVNVAFPPYVVKPEYQKPRGESQLTERGIE